MTGASGRPVPRNHRAVVCSVNDHLAGRCDCFTGIHAPCDEHHGRHCERCEKPWPCPSATPD